MNEESWREIVRKRRTPSDEQFASNLKVETRQRSDHLRVTFKDKDPVVAAAAVRSIIAAYEHAFSVEQRKVEGQRMDQLRGRRESLSSELQRIEAAMGPIAEGRSIAELDPLCAAAAERVRKLSSALADVQTAMAGGADPLARPAAPARSVTESAADEILRICEVEQARIENQLAQFRAQGLGPAHPAVVRLTASAQEYRDRAERYTQAMAARREAVVVTAPPLVSLSEREANILSLAKTAQEDLKRLASQREQLAVFEEQATTVRKSLAETDTRLDALDTEASLGSRLTVISGGEMPMTALQDNRAKTAMAGVMAGMAAPLGLLILRGSIRRRYRACDDVAADLRDQAPFVAVIPDLTESDDLGGAASRCVHDLRVRLQPSSTSDPRTYLITSASAGEGKTSLAVALGLSFAGAGFRTLLVDCDLTSRRLSCEFDASESPGIIEATGGSEPLIWRIRGGLSVLAAGRCRPQDANRLAPAATARILSDIRERFDVVLIDGDPILTGITASVIAPQVSGVILAMARGQEQSVVQGAIKHIGILGAGLAGAVFNRAPASDFRAAQNDLPGSRDVALPERLNRFGPLVGAVLSSLSLTREEDLDLMPIGMSLANPDRAQRAVA